MAKRIFRLSLSDNEGKLMRTPGTFTVLRLPNIPSLRALQIT